MEKWFERIYKNGKRYLIIFLIAVLMFLLLVNVLFKIESGIYWLEAEWLAADVIVFAGTILSFLGSVVLGCITTKVSIDNNSINKRLFEIEEKRENLERDRRLGQIIPFKLDVELRGRFLDEGTDIEEFETNSIFLSFAMKVTAESVINKVIRKNIKVWCKGFKDDFDNNLSVLGWIPFYENAETLVEGLNQIDKEFVEKIIISKYNREVEPFEMMEKLVENNTPYLVSIEYEYENILKEKRKIVLSIVCNENCIIRNEIISID